MWGGSFLIIEILNMKYIITIAILFFSFTSKSQTKAVVWQGWDFIFDSTGKEVARRDINTGKWDITNASIALESQYKELKSVRPKYNVVCSMLNLVHDGKVSEADKQQWQSLLAQFLKLNK
jgi:NADPH:quinone reductase-like Zn-dependent oxidoreductase